MWRLLFIFLNSGFGDSDGSRNRGLTWEPSIIEENLLLNVID